VPHQVRPNPCVAGSLPGGEQLLGGTMDLQRDTSSSTVARLLPACISGSNAHNCP